MKYIAALLLLFTLTGCTDDVKLPVQQAPTPSYTPFTHAPTLSP